jgi:hypothetical protein
MEQDNCQPPKDTDWEEAQLVEVALAAQEGIPGAVAELQRREKLIDTVSAKASVPSPVIEWIEE